MNFGRMTVVVLVSAHLATGAAGAAPVVVRGGQKVDDGVIVTLGSGKAIKLTDLALEQYGDGAKAFTYLEYLPGIRQHLLQVGLYEGGYLLAIDDRSGDQVELPGAPLVSPDGRWIASIATHGEPYGLEREEIWEVSASGLRLAYRARGACRPAKWLDANSLRLERSESKFCWPTKASTVRLAGKRWVETIDPPPPATP
jgi:hypothetical protein